MLPAYQCAEMTSRNRGPRGADGVRNRPRPVDAMASDISGRNGERTTPTPGKTASTSTTGLSPEIQSYVWGISRNQLGHVGPPLVDIACTPWDEQTPGQYE